MGVTVRGDARKLAVKLKGLTVGMRHGYKVPKVHPRLLPEERDLIVVALEAYGESIAKQEAVSYVASIP